MYNLYHMAINTNYHFRPASPLSRRWASNRVLDVTLKGLLFAAMLLPTVALDLCQQRDTAHLCAGNLGKPRSQMPQIVGLVRERFLTDISQVTEVNRERIPASELIPIQSEMSQEAVFKMVQARKNGEYDPCVTEILAIRNQTNHTHIVDGHHTATACRLSKGVQLAIVIKDWGINVFERILNFPGVFRVGLQS